MDNFKVFNDSFNHDVGDQVIEWFVSAVKRFLHPNEYLIRSGGEEFIFILNHCDKQKTLEKVEGIRSFIEKEKIPITFNDEELELSCTASFGISFYEGKRNQTLDSTLIYADNLLYESKHNGKNQITCK
jgi:diguanylate cyclase (GGDEF)-like protein